MKHCPYCKAEIPEDALKCMYCTSTLMPPVADAQHRDDAVTYVVDRGLLRFGKFAAATLALFLTVGAFFYGFDLKQAAKEVQAAREDAKKTLSEIRESEQFIANAKRSIEDTHANASRTYEAIVASAKRGDELIVRLEGRLSSTQRETLLEVKVSKPDKFRAYAAGDENRLGPKLWANGTRLKVKFLDGTPEEQSLVKAMAEEWARYANVSFEFSVTREADIRITFGKPGAWSYVGTDALAVPSAEPTMVLGLVRLLPKEKAKATVLHEFGHALGLVHENQIPKADIVWNREAVESVYGRDVAEQALYHKQPYPTEKQFDPQSIMITGNEIPRAFVKNGQAFGFNYAISTGDKQFIALLYPRTNELQPAGRK